LCYCVCFKGWLQVYYGLDLLLSKLSKAQSNGKFRERNNDIVRDVRSMPPSITYHPTCPGLEADLLLNVQKHRHELRQARKA
jgi:hypothetical protein